MSSSYAEGLGARDNVTANQDATILKNIRETTNATSQLNTALQINSSQLTGAGLSISGTAFNDSNGDGFRAKDEPGLPGWTIMLERDGKEVRTTTNDSGRYIFSNLEDGRYTVTENMVAKWNLTSPSGGNYTINLVDRDAVNYDFGNIPGPETDIPQEHPIMAKNTWNQRTQAIKNLPKAGASPEGIVGVSYPSSFSLLSHLPYTASERDQGNCGNCWVWGCTAPIEVAHDVQNGVHDRLSIQYLNSNYNGGSGYGWACCGGWELDFQNFYNSQGKFIPWSNSNANYQDGGRQCSGGTSVPASSISTSPDYPITPIQWHEIQTAGVSTTQAISNIKSYLYANKAVTLAFYLPDFQPFWNFWAFNSGNWDPDSYCGLSDGAYPGGHEVTVVGWDDSTNSWIVLNSWGIDYAHPDGTFKLKMDMNYNCINGGYYSYSFGYFDVAFSDANHPPNTPSIPSGPGSGAAGTSYSYSTSTTDPDGDQVKYTFDWGDGTTSVTNFVNSGTIASASHTWTVSSGSTTTFNVRARSADDNGLSSIDWSNPLSVSITGLTNLNWKSGSTSPGSTNWQAYGSNAIYVDVDTDAAGFTATPRYFTSLGGLGNHWDALGVNAIYSATSTGFRIYMKNWNGASLTPAYANSNKWYVQWLGVPASNTNSGATPMGTTNWQAYGSNAIYVDVNTGAAGFTETPRYFTSLGGLGSQWDALGVNAIYSATSTGFRIYLKNWNGAGLTPAYANSNKWYVQWLGVPTTNTNSGATPMGTTNWQAYGSNAIYVDVNTGAAGFTETPHYFASLGGLGSQWDALGVNAIYSPTSTGFRIYLKNWNGAGLTPAYANSNKWYVQWLGE